MAAADKEVPIQKQTIPEQAQKGDDIEDEKASGFDSDIHYAIRKMHMKIAIGLLLLIAVGVGWELNNLHHPVQLSFCADGPQGVPASNAK